MLKFLQLLFKSRGVIAKYGAIAIIIIEGIMSIVEAVNEKNKENELSSNNKNISRR